MTTPGVDPSVGALLSSDDLASFQQSDPNWFLAAAGETIRTFCQWHIAPNITVTERVPIQPEGTIMLPSLHVTGVDSVAINGLELDPTSYQWHQAGYIHQIQQAFFQWPLWPLESDQPFREYPCPLARYADVTYTHGFVDLPMAVRVVGMELANRAMELPSGVATQISSGPYSINLGALGVVLSADQRNRLGPYTLVRF
jgi:hypothetical protein